MSTPVSPSPVIETFVSKFKDFLPDDQKSKLQTHESAIAATTSEGDESRALRCAIWAMKTASNKSDSHPRWKEVKDVHKIWKETLFDAEWGLTTRHSSIGDEVRTGWIQSATDVIRYSGEDDGWQNSHWEELLVELINLKS
jgi:hypothetical protein